MTSSEFIANAESIFVMAGVVVGGLWAYFNYFRGRVFYPRLELELESKFHNQSNSHCIVITYKVKNVGLSRVKFNHKGNALRVYSAIRVNNAPFVHKVLWERLATFDVLSDHGWIESGETITETQLISIPQEVYSEDKLAIKTTLRVVSMKKTEWNIGDTIQLLC